MLVSFKHLQFYLKHFLKLFKKNCLLFPFSNFGAIQTLDFFFAETHVFFGETVEIPSGHLSMITEDTTSVFWRIYPENWA